MRSHLQGRSTKRRLQWWVRPFLALLLIGAFGTVGAAQRAADRAVASPEIVGSDSGGRITTEVTSETYGELSGADLRDLSVIGSHALALVGDARRALDANDLVEARQHTQRALELIDVVRKMMPTTVQTLKVMDAEGATLFENTRRVPEENIPLYTVVSRVNFLEPVVEAMRDDADVQGVRLSDADLVHTHLTLDIGLLERRLREAAQAQELDEADAALVAALSQAVQLTQTRIDEPLAVVRDALWYAQRAASAGNYSSARANLLTARQRLAIYRDLLPEDDRSEAIRLYGQLTDLVQRIEDTDEAGEASQNEVMAEIEGLFDRVASWFQRPTSETRSGDVETAETRTP